MKNVLKVEGAKLVLTQPKGAMHCRPIHSGKGPLHKMWGDPWRVSSGYDRRHSVLWKV